MISMQRYPIFWAFILILRLFAVFEVNVFLLPCPVGFVLDLTTSTCDCRNLLKDYAINCSIETQEIHRRAPLWISGREDGVIVHEHCPLNYCKPGSFDINLERPNEQCAFHRSGILCGGRQVGYSQVLGSSVCKRCSNWWPVLTVFPFALAGLVLVIPLIDAHTGPYLVRHRHWTRMLLLLRVGLILVFTVNILGDPAINLLAILLLL